MPIGKGNSSYSIHQLNYIHSAKTNMLIKQLFQCLHCLEPKMCMVHTPMHRACSPPSLTASWKAHCLQGACVWQGSSELPTAQVQLLPGSQWQSRVTLKLLFTQDGLACNMDKGLVKMNSSLTKTSVSKCQEGDCAHTEVFCSLPPSQQQNWKV